MPAISMFYGIIIRVFLKLKGLNNMIKIKNVIPENNFKLKIEFENGLLKIFDMEPYLKYDVFS